MLLTETLPTAHVTAIIDERFVMCPNCQNKHALFYKRSKSNKLSLHYICDKTRQHWSEGDSQHYKFTTRQGDVQFVAGLPVPEKWTAYKRKGWQEEQMGQLL